MGKFTKAMDDGVKELLTVGQEHWKRCTGRECGGPELQRSGSGEWTRTKPAGSSPSLSHIWLRSSEVLSPEVFFCMFGMFCHGLS